MNIVLDTNVIVSGIINPEGYPAKLLNLFLNGNLTINADARILSEYERILKSSKFSFPKEYVETLLSFISSESILKTAQPLSMPVVAVKDPADAPFIEISLGEDIPLITGNRKHFENIKKIKLYSPKDFFENFSSLSLLLNP